MKKKPKDNFKKQDLKGRENTSQSPLMQNTFRIISEIGQKLSLAGARQQQVVRTKLTVSPKLLAYRKNRSKKKKAATKSRRKNRKRR